MSNGNTTGVARLQDVAALAGVSIKTVSNVVHDYPHVSAKMRARVQEAIDQLGYRPNLTARRLATGRTGMIALALPELDQPYFAEIARHISTESGRRGYRIMVEQTLNDVEAERAVIRDREKGLVDGVIFQPVHINTLEIARMRPETPLVLLGEAARPLTFDHVMIDNVAAAEEAVMMLTRQGRQRIAFFGTVEGDHTEATQLRLLGYQQAMVATGGSMDPNLIVHSGGFDMDSAVGALTAAIERGLHLDALLCRDDLFALAALRTLRNSGLKVPDDVAVMGWDDTAIARNATPAVSSVAPDKAAIARTALDLLIDRMEGHAGPGRHILEGYQIRERETSGRSA